MIVGSSGSRAERVAPVSRMRLFAPPAADSFTPSSEVIVKVWPWVQRKFAALPVALTVPPVEGFSDPLMVLGVCLPLEWMHVEARKLGLFVWIVNGICCSLIVLGLVFGSSGSRPQVPALAAA